MIARALTALVAFAALLPAAASAQSTVYFNGAVNYSPGAHGRYLLTTPAAQSAQYLTDDCYRHESGSYSLAHYDNAWHLVDADHCDLFAMSLPNRIGPGAICALSGPGLWGQPYSVDCEPKWLRVTGLNSWSVGGNPEGTYTRAAQPGDSDEACYDHDDHPISLLNVNGTWLAVNAPGCQLAQSDYSLTVHTNYSADPTQGTWLVEAL